MRPREGARGDVCGITGLDPAQLHAPRAGRAHWRQTDGRPDATRSIAPRHRASRRGPVHGCAAERTARVATSVAANEHQRCRRPRRNRRQQGPRAARGQASASPCRLLRTNDECDEPTSRATRPAKKHQTRPRCPFEPRGDRLARPLRQGSRRRNISAPRSGNLHEEPPVRGGRGTGERLARRARQIGTACAVHGSSMTQMRSPCATCCPGDTPSIPTTPSR